MDTTLYAVYDLAAGAVIPETIHAARHQNVAIRSFTDAVMHPESRFGKHATDYQLVQLGNMNEQGQIEPDWRTVISAETIMDAAAAAKEQK